MSSFERFSPPLRSMQLIAYIAVFIVLPVIYAPKGFQFALLTLALIVGLQPHIDRLSEEGHKLKFALNEAKFFGFTLWSRHEFPIPLRIRISNKRLSNSVASVLALFATILFLPGMLYVAYRAARLFIDRIDDRWESIAASLSSVLVWAQEVAPQYVPKGDMTAVFGAVFADLVGDAKHVMTEVSAEVASFVGHLAGAYFEIIITMILLGVLVSNWNVETNNLRWRIEKGIPNEVIARRTIRFGELYREALGIILAGYIEVGLALTIYYFVVLTIFGFNLGLGFALILSCLFGFTTAIPKIGGIATKIISPLVVIMLFPEGFGFFGYELFSFGLGVDLLVKALLIFATAFIGGYLEAYEYTPEKIGKKLGITKMEMVMTILIWAIGAKFMGMVYGVLLMLLIPCFTKLLKECEEGDEFKRLP